MSKANGDARPIKAEFYKRMTKLGEPIGDPEKVIRGVHIRSMSWRTFDHMQVDQYGARLALVFNLTTGKAWAIYTRTPRGVTTVFKEDPRELADE